MPEETPNQTTENLEAPAEGLVPGETELPAGETGSDEPETPTEG